MQMYNLDLNTMRKPSPFCHSLNDSTSRIQAGIVFLRDINKPQYLPFNPMKQKGRQ